MGVMSVKNYDPGQNLGDFDQERESAFILYNELLLGIGNIYKIYVDNLLRNPISVNKKFLRNKWFNNIVELKDYLTKKEFILLYQLYEDLSTVDNLLPSRINELSSRITGIYLKIFEFNSFGNPCYYETTVIEKMLKHEYRMLILKIQSLSYDHRELGFIAQTFSIKKPFGKESAENDIKKRFAYEGKGKFYYGKNYYEGEFKYGFPNGNGKFFENGSLIYEGTWSYGTLINGTRTEYYDDGDMWYKAAIKNERRDEEEKVKVKFNKKKIAKNENIYEVTIVKNKFKDGYILEFDINGNLRYEGEVKNFKYNGRGIKYSANGYREFAGWFEHGELVNEGEEYYSNGNLKYRGHFKKSLYHGEGIIVYENGKKKLVGSFIEGHINGIGTEYGPNGEIVYEGGFDRGKRHGKGTLYKFNNKKIHPLEGIWEYDVLISYNQHNKNGDLMPGKERIETEEGKAVIVYDENDNEILMHLKKLALN